MPSASSHYHQLQPEDRVTIASLRQQNHSVRAIARQLHRSPATISRELQRNRGKRGYSYRQADARAQARTKREVWRRFTTQMQAELERALRYKQLTPQLISQQARAQGRPFACKETLYQYVYAESRTGGTLWTCLPRSHKRRWRRCSRRENGGRGRLLPHRRIDERPAEVAARETVGHWEGNLIQGAAESGHLVTLVERKTRFALVG